MKIAQGYEGNVHPYEGNFGENMRKPRQRETEELLQGFKRFLTYNETTGKLTFKDNRFGAVKVGQEAGSVRSDGYVGIYHRGQNYMAHRLAWALHYNKWPEHTIDHINRDGTDNRIENLRDVPQAINNQNKSKYRKTA